MKDHRAIRPGSAPPINLDYLQGLGKSLIPELRDLACVGPRNLEFDLWTNVSRVLCNIHEG